MKDDIIYPRFCIAIPTINRFDLLLPSLLMYSMDMPNTEVIIYDNGKQFISDKINGIRNVRGCHNAYKAVNNITVLGGTGDNAGVAGSWNIMCAKAFEKYDYVLVLNDDIYFQSSEFDVNGIINYMSNASIDFFCCEEKYDRAVFLMSKKCFNVVGSFDSNFAPAYYEDNDYLYRLKLAKMRGKIDYGFVPSLNPTLFRRSSSLLKHPDMLVKDGNDYRENNKKYYILKWGGEVGSEKYLHPFGA